MIFISFQCVVFIGCVSQKSMVEAFRLHLDGRMRNKISSLFQDRMVRCLRWYLSAFHAGRRSDVAKKPYNPILGETFLCYWPSNNDDKNSKDCGNSSSICKQGPTPWAPENSVCFIAEQVRSSLVLSS